MAKVMLRESEGKTLFYVAKKDLEAVIAAVEFESDEKWGGRIELDTGDLWYIEPGPRKIPSEVNARKLADDD